jgi:hypothetical protein
MTENQLPFIETTLIVEVRLKLPGAGLEIKSRLVMGRFRYWLPCSNALKSTATNTYRRIFAALNRMS